MEKKRKGPRIAGFIGIVLLMASFIAAGCTIVNTKDAKPAYTNEGK